MSSLELSYNNKYNGVNDRKCQKEAENSRLITEEGGKGMSKKYCMNCGHENEEDARFCSGCGKEVERETGDLSPPMEEHAEGGEPLRPADDEPVNIVQEPASSGSPKKKMSSKNKVILLGVIALVILGCIIGGVNIKKQKDREKALAEAEKKRNEEIQVTDEYNNYISKLNGLKMDMMSGASDAESVCLLTYKVWYNKIYKKSSDDTAKYVDGASDFNEAVQNVYADEAVAKQLENVQNKQSSAEEWMKSLQSPSEEFEKCYDLALELNSAYVSLASFAQVPEGTLKDYGEKEEEKVETFVSAYQKFEAAIPEKKMYLDENGKPENEFVPFTICLNQNVSALPDEIERTEEDDALGRLEEDTVLCGVQGTMTYSYGGGDNVVWFMSWVPEKDSIKEEQAEKIIKKLEKAYGKPEQIGENGKFIYSWSDENEFSIMVETDELYSRFKVSWMSTYTSLL